MSLRPTSVRHMSNVGMDFLRRAHYGWKSSPCWGSFWCLSPSSSWSARNQGGETGVMRGEQHSSFSHSTHSSSHSSSSTPAAVPLDESSAPSCFAQDSSSATQCFRQSSSQLQRNEAYCKALAYACGPSRRARDWLAGFAALTTSSSVLVTLALQYEATWDDVERFVALIERDKALSPDGCDTVIRCFAYDCLTAVVRGSASGAGGVRGVSPSTAELDHHHQHHHHLHPLASSDMERAQRICHRLGITSDDFAALLDLVREELELARMKRAVIGEDTIDP